MENHHSKHKLVEQTQVGLPKAYHDNDDPKIKSLPLTFLDLPFTGPIYVRRQFFYNFPFSTNHFYQNTLPTLKLSLSLTLQRFFPLAGNLLCPPPPHKPFIQCTNEDTVTFTIIESASNFDHISSNDPKSVKDLDHLVPTLMDKATHDKSDDTIVSPLVALQVTVFSNSGLCIAITYCHVMDDRCCGHFMKFWSSLCGIINLEEIIDSTLLKKHYSLLPCFDREILKDPNELEAVLLKDYFNERTLWKDKLVAQSQNGESILEEDYVKTTIVFGREGIEAMKRFAMNKLKKSNGYKAPQYLSTFMVICGFVWSSLIKTTRHDDNNEGGEEEEEEEEHFHFPADCRNNNLLGYPIPITYFGNCITQCQTKLKRMELKGEDGFVNAVKVIEKGINDMKSSPFRGAENWKALFMKLFVLGNSAFHVMASHKLGVYETDFGFGRPKKVEMVHSSKAISLAESGHVEGGVEVGLVLKRVHYQRFVHVLKQGLQILMNN
ncbi:hypothetical protein HN51_019490 [Arachis hypogaea]|uniref:coumaroyl-CoA:anthocyanidin 3-O-glucoside-6''-O-coumaroyltransferase 1-like n=1 Tax=Arachis hypogaea TaxID=3818 RepID=UPI000DEC09CD|nr:coumaroyl-CoA:anthocyanidin 3-O-glucoside-6''-O-coumaroyltransferase 1-like [Arachis hypogaea]